VTPDQQFFVIPVATFAIVMVVGLWVMSRPTPKNHHRHVRHERQASTLLISPAPPKPTACAQCGGGKFVWDAARRRWICMGCTE
jgi:hypothetical protein